MKFFPFTFLLLVFSCNDASDIIDEKTEVVTLKNDMLGSKSPDFDARMKTNIRASLQIPITEKYKFQIHKEYIDSDTILDAIITVNRKDFAINEAIRENKQAKAAELGFIGNYNFIFYYNGAMNKLSVPIPIGSSPGRPLGVSFESITSPSRKDVIVAYRIRNSEFLSFYTSPANDQLLRTFMMKRFDAVGTDTPEAFLYSIEDSKEGMSKDILQYESEIDNYSKEIEDIYEYKPSISKKNKLVARWFFVPSQMKFAKPK